MGASLERELSEYAAQREAAMQNKMQTNQMAQPSDNSTLGNAGRGMMTGLARSGTSTLGMVGKLLGSQGVQDYAKQSGDEAQDYWDPHGTAGRVGEAVGEGTGNAGQFMAAGGILGKAVPAIGRTVAGINNPLARSLVGALPASAAHAALTSATDDTGEKGFFGTLARDEGGVALFHGAGSMLGRVGRGLGGLASKALGKVAGSDAGAALPTPDIAPPVSAPTGAPAPVVAEPPAPAPAAAAPEAPPAAPVQPPAAPTPAPVAPTAPVADPATKLSADLEAAAPKAKPAKVKAKTGVASAAATTPQEAAPTETPAVAPKARAKAKAAKPAAPAPEQPASPTEQKPAAAPKTGSQKGGKAKPTVAPKAADSNSGSAPAPSSGFSKKDARDLGDAQDYLPQITRIREGLSPQSSQAKTADATIAKLKADIERLTAKRGPGK